jgi:hypothetical protein
MDVTHVIIQWKDAAMYGDATYYKEDVDSIQLASLVSSGILVKEDDTSITLCQDLRPADRNFGISYRGVHVYPKTGITIIHRNTIKHQEFD